MRESSVWASLKDSGQLPFAVRIESPASPGVPDVYFSTGVVTGWIELKSVPESHKKLITRGTGQGQLRPLQVLWARQASEKNIFTTVLLFAEKRGILIAGEDVEDLLSAPSEQVLSKALWVGNTTPSKRWDGLKEKLDKHGKEIIRMATKCTDSLGE